jgi:feruloyl esterase
MIALVSALASAQQTCEQLADLKLSHTTITLAKSIPAGMFTPLPAAERKSEPGDNSFAGLAFDLPAFCRVTGVIKPTSDSDIKFEIWLPTGQWNGKLQQAGNGGFAGVIPYWSMIPALRRGYVTAATDNGHSGGGPPVWAIGHPEKVTDFGFRAVHETAVKTKVILGAYYGHSARRSYFVGCSEGGREALMEAQRFPEDFDGILAGAPANDWINLFASFVWNGRTFLDNPASYIPANKLEILQAGAVAACDMLDGVKDGILANPTSCKFDPAVLQCKGVEDSAACLTAPQVEAAKKIYAGPTDSRTGKEIFPGMEPGGEAGRGGWGPWITGPEPGKSLAYFFASTFFADMVFEDPKWDLGNFKFDKDIQVAQSKLGPILNSTSPDLRRFKGRGGKLIQYHGWADYAIPPRSSINYYESVAAFSGGLEKTQNFYRLFMVPGLEHCSGGTGPTTFMGTYQVQPSLEKAELDRVYSNAENDIVLALEKWVEEGVAPKRIIASKYADDKPAKGISRTWLLCPYPEQARWNGKGSTDESANFVCERSPQAR